MGSKILLTLIFVFIFSTRGVLATNTQPDWPMAGADPQRTSHNNVNVTSPKLEWYHVIDPFVDSKVQVIAAGGKVFLSTSKGLVAFDAKTGAQLWFFGTELPPGHSPTYYNNVVYLPGFDHRIRAIDPSTGTEKSGYTPYEAGAGFETNPLIVNNIIYAGNRDGYFYALDAVNGSLKWRYQTNGPIRFSAAISKDNSTVFFASEDSFGYALNAGTGALVWKTPKLPGYGFATYWPTVWTDTYSGSATYNKEFVIFTASQKTMSFLPVTSGETTDRYFNQNPNISWGSYAGTCGGESTYNWAVPQIIDRCDVSTYFKNYYNQHPGQPDRRNVFIFEKNQTSQTAAEYQVTTGNFAPINWQSAANGGNKFPLIIGYDNILYTPIGHIGGGNGGSRGWISGWKFGTSFINKIYTANSGAADEPMAYTSGGKYIYWIEFINADTMGSVDISTNTFNAWGYNPHGAGPKDKYSNPDGTPSLELSAIFNGSGNANKINGVYSLYDGVANMSPIPYDAGDHTRLFFVTGNTLFALSQVGGTSPDKGIVTAPTTFSSATINTNVDDLTKKLNEEVQKIVSAGPLRPGFSDTAYLSKDLNSNMGRIGVNKNGLVAGDHLMEYFHTPGDTVTALSLAMPYLNSTLKVSVQNYLQTHYGIGKTYDLTNIAHIGWKTGSARETFMDTPELTTYFTGNPPSGGWLNFSGPSQTNIMYANPCCQIFVNSGDFPPDAPYAAWKYAQAQNYTQSQALTLFNAIKGKLQDFNNTDLIQTDSITGKQYFLTWPYLLNQYIAGYRGYLELEKMANGWSNINQDAAIYNKYMTLLNLRTNNFSKDAPVWQSASDYAGNHLLNTARNFMFMTPELGIEMNISNKTAVQSALDEYYLIEPFWFVPHYERTYGEGWLSPLWSRSALFQAKARILKQPYSEIVKYLDVPYFEKGDLFWIQNAVAVLDAAAPSVSGDLNGDGKVDILDLRLAIKNFSSVFELTTVIANYGK